MIAMMISGRLTNRIDSRVIMGLGVVPLSLSLWRLSQWTPAIGESTLIYNTMIQGEGVGFIFVPLNVVAFATLAPQLRYEATSFVTLALQYRYVARHLDLRGADHAEYAG
jgi:MFS transporter, DHA2 family, multidrug resistance protein